jgi:HKD family nuclease
MKTELLTQPFGSSVGDRLIAELSSGRWQRFRCAVAFAKPSGVKYLDQPLRRFAAAGGVAELAIGIDSRGTSFEAANQLAGAVEGSGRLIITTEIGAGSPSFHPKVYAFTSDGGGEALAIVGSSNLTEGGLFTNHELSTAFELDLSQGDDIAFMAAVEKSLRRWQQVSSGLAVLADKRRLRALHAEGRLPLEGWISAYRSAAAPSAARGPGTRGLKGRGKSRPKHPTKLGAPLAPPPATSPAPPTPPAPPPPAPTRPTHDVFYIDITTTTVTTEIYLAKRALWEDPRFFRHPFTGLTPRPKKKTSPRQPQLDPKPLVDIRLIDKAGKPVPQHVYPGHELKVWEYVAGRANQDVRVTIPQALRRSLPKGCILEMRRDPEPGLDYRLDFLTPGSKRWSTARKRASLPLPNSWRKMGWA